MESAKKYDTATILKVLDLIDEVAAKRVSEGFNHHHFMRGVLNCFMITFTFGRYPQHFWILVVVELMILIPLKMHANWNDKPLNNVLFYLDYCWVMNILAMFVILSLVVQTFIDLKVGHEFRYQAYVTFYGTACGPLLGATIVLPFVSAVFHSFSVMTGTFIHILPPMVLYTFMWHSEEIKEAWPSVLKLDYLEDVKFFPEGKFFILPGTHLGTVAGNTLALYMAWFIPYVCWMALIGLNLPRKNRINKDGSLIAPRFDTVFSSTVRGGLTVYLGKVLWGRPEEVSKKQVENDDYELRDFAVYMAMHAFMIYMSVFLLAYPCYRSQKVHAAFLIFLTIICVKRGADRYDYYVTAMYGKAIRKSFAANLSQELKKDK